MRDTLYSVWFEKGQFRSVYASGPIQASILAQAKAIEGGLDFEISSIQDQETGQTYTVALPKIQEETKCKI